MKQIRTGIKILIWIIVPEICLAQANDPVITGQNYIFRESKELQSTSLSSPLKKISEPWGRSGRSLIAIDGSGQKVKYLKNEIWGYERKNDVGIRRIVHKEEYWIEENSSIIIYKKCVKGGGYFFSTGLDSQLFPFNKKHVLKLINDCQLVALYKSSALFRELMQ